MSIKVMTLVWEGYPGSGSEMLAMLALADWCNDEGGSLHPSMRAVADKIRVSEKQARRIMHRFEEEGLLIVVGNANGGAPGATKQYRLNVEMLKRFAYERAAAAEHERTKTAPASVTPPIDVTPPMGGRVGLPPVGGYASHGCPDTAPTGGSQTVSEPPVNRQLTTSCGEAVSTQAELTPAVAHATPPSKGARAETPLQIACRETWNAYCRAYTDRYGAPPVRAAKQNAQVKQIVQALGAEEAPQVAAWFVRHPAQWYVTKGHDIGLLLTDITKLRTEWATGRVVTSTVARQADRRGAMASAVQNLLSECEGG